MTTNEGYSSGLQSVTFFGGDFFWVTVKGYFWITVTRTVTLTVTSFFPLFIYTYMIFTLKVTVGYS